SGAAAGNLEITVESASRPTVPTNPQNPQSTPVAPASTGTGETINDVVPGNGSYTYSFAGTAGQVVTVTVRATSNELDPKAVVIGPNGTIVAENDDHEDNDPNLSSFDSRIQ